MADEVLNLQIQINAETGQLEVVSRGLSSIGNEAKKTDDSFLGLSKSAVSILKTLGLIVSIGSLAKFFSDAVTSAEEFNQSIKRVEFSLKALGKESELSTKELIKWADAIQKSTRFTDDDAISTLNRFIRATGDIVQSQTASKLAMDIAVASGKDLAQVTEILTGLMIGNTRTVLEATREFGAFTKGSRDAQTILDELQKAFTGASTKEQSLTKDTKQLSNAFNDLKKELGELFSPVVEQVTEFLTKSVQGWTTIIKKFKDEQIKINVELDIDKTINEHKKLLDELGRNTDEYNKIDIKNKKTTEEKKLSITEDHIRLVAKKSQEQIKEEEKIQKEKIEKLHKMQDEAIERYKDAEEKSNEERKKGIRDVAQFTSQEFGRAFADAIMETKNLDEAFQQMGQNIIRMIIQMVAQMAVLKALTGSVTGAGTGGLFGFAGFLAEGGKAESGKTYLVGEEGAEILKMGTTGGEVISNRELTELKPSKRIIDNDTSNTESNLESTVNVYVNLSTEKLSIDNGKAIIQVLAREIADKTAEAVKLSVLMKNLGDRNSMKAV